nr:uncharacterized protein LOC109168900 [Ipomoea batatas]
MVVPVIEEDVHYTLGLPRGSVVITKRRKDDVSDTLKEWRSKFNKVKHDVTLAMIATKVRSLLEGDVWFKRHFAILVVSVLGGTMKNGGWSSRHLKARQLSEIRSGGFGRGIVE